MYSLVQYVLITLKFTTQSYPFFVQLFIIIYL